MMTLEELTKAIRVVLDSAREETGEVWLWFNHDGTWDVDQYDNTSYAINCVVNDLEGATPEDIAKDLWNDLQVELDAGRLVIRVTYSEQLDVRHRWRWWGLDGFSKTSADAQTFKSFSAAGQQLAAIEQACELADLTIESIVIGPLAGARNPVDD